MVANIKSLQQGVVFGEGDSNLVWEVDDRYGHTRAVRIPDLMNENRGTKYALVYGKDEKGNWNVAGQISDRYQPIPTSTVVDIVKGRLNYPILTERVTQNNFGTRQRVQLVLDTNPIEVQRTPFDRDSRWTAHTQTDLSNRIRTDKFFPMVTIENGYAANKAIEAYIGWFRVVCSNGLVIPTFDGATFTTRRIHTLHEVERLVDDLGNFEIRAAQLDKTLKALTKRKLTESELKKFQKMVPKNYREEMAEQTALGKNTAYAALTYLTYMQTHRMTIARSKIVQPVIEWIMRIVA